MLWCHFPRDGLALISLSPPRAVAQTQLLHSLRVCSDAFIHKTISAVCPRLLFVLLACFPCKQKYWGGEYSMGRFVCWMSFQICATTILYTIFNLWCSIVWAERKRGISVVIMLFFLNLHRWRLPCKVSICTFVISM